MSDYNVLLLKAIESFGDLVFWLMMIPAILKYNIFGRLPWWLSVPMLFGAGVSGVAGVAVYYFS